MFLRCGKTPKTLEDFEQRLSKLEKQGSEQVLTLVEILSNMAFFGSANIEECKHAKDGQCGFFFLKEESKKTLPTSMDCRIEDCTCKSPHCHLELSKMTCALCSFADLDKT
jgi:hypothetical protein